MEIIRLKSMIMTAKSTHIGCLGGFTRCSICIYARKTSDLCNKFLRAFKK